MCDLLDGTFVINRLTGAPGIAQLHSKAERILSSAWRRNKKAKPPTAHRETWHAMMEMSPPFEKQKPKATLVHRASFGRSSFFSSWIAATVIDYSFVLFRTINIAKTNFRVKHLCEAPGFS
jgi:hypothetical protein